MRNSKRGQSADAPDLATAKSVNMPGPGRILVRHLLLIRGYEHSAPAARKQGPKLVRSPVRRTGWAINDRGPRAARQRLGFLAVKPRVRPGDVRPSRHASKLQRLRAGDQTR